MARRASKTVQHPSQLGFFDTTPVEMSGFGMRLRETLADTLARAKERKGMDRYDIAAAIGRVEPEREVSKHMLDRFCAPSSAEWRLPAELIPSLYRVTGDDALLRLIVSACDHKIIPNKAAVMGELLLVDLEQQKLDERREKLMKCLSPTDIDWATQEIRRGTSHDDKGKTL